MADITKRDADDVARLRASLINYPRPRVRSGREAFRQHMLLAARVHRAAGLNQTGSKEGEGFVQYVTEHFPTPRNEDAEAWLLWKKWRTPLLKDETPGKGVAITHGQPHLHWRRDLTGGDLVLDLESLWADFNASVEHFVEHLRGDARRRSVALSRWRRTTWTVQNVEDPVVGTAIYPFTVSAATSLTVVRDES